MFFVLAFLHGKDVQDRVQHQWADCIVTDDSYDHASAGRQNQHP